jgi:hypothetical protein
MAVQHLPKSIRKALKEHKLLQAVIKTGNRTGEITISSMECEKYNNCDPISLEVSDLPMADGHFDIEGHNSTDISVSYKDSVWSLLWSFPLAVLAWGRDLIILRDWGMAKIFHPFRLTGSGWLFVVDSFEVQMGEYAEEIVRLIYPKLQQTNRQEFDAEVMKARKALDYSRLSDHLVANGYWKVNGWLYVDKKDPTVMVVDESVCRYDLKNGWSDRKIASIISMWVNLILFTYYRVITQ